jgi:hypothetical protein
MYNVQKVNNFTNYAASRRVVQPRLVSILISYNQTFPSLPSFLRLTIRTSQDIKLLLTTRKLLDKRREDKGSYHNRYLLFSEFNLL